MPVDLPSVGSHLKLSVPCDKVLLLTMNRPAKYNAMTSDLQADMDKAFDFFEAEPSFWVAVLTGVGKAFCAGQDLSSESLSLHKCHLIGRAVWLESQQTGTPETGSFVAMRTLQNPTGFGGMSLRRFKKPVVAACQGGAHGGGCEMLLNCDMVIAGDNVKISLPEPLRGVAALAGGISRMYRVAGHHVAAEALLTGRAYTGQEARDILRIVNYVVPNDKVLQTAIEWAQKICQASPDSVQLTKQGMNMAAFDSMGDTEVAKALARSDGTYGVMAGENCMEGLMSFQERRAPKWSDPPVDPIRRPAKL